MLAQKSQFAEAEKEFREALTFDGHYQPALFHLGVTLLRSGDVDDAVRLLAQATQANPKDGIAFYYLGNALEGKHDPTGALQAYQQAAQLVPDMVPLQTRLGMLLQRSGDSVSAAAAFKKWLHSHPTIPRPTTILGWR